MLYVAYEPFLLLWQPLIFGTTDGLFSVNSVKEWKLPNLPRCVDDPLLGATCIYNL